MNSEQYYEDELSLIDIYKVLKKYWPGILITPIVLMFFSVLFAKTFIQPCYRAYGTILIGQIDGKSLESGFVLQQRMRDMSFISEVIKTHRDVFRYESNLAAEEAWLNKGLEVKKDKDTDLVSFTLLAHKPDRAKLKAQALIDTLKQKHSELYNADVQMMHNQIDVLSKQISEMEQDDQQFRKSLAQSRGLSSYNAVVDALVVRDQSHQLRDLINKKNELETALNPALTFNTRLLGGIYVTPSPVAPNLQLIAAISFLVGLFGAVFVAFVRNALKTADI